MFSFRKARKDVKTEEKLKERSAVALLCGSILRAFAWGWSMLPPGQSFFCNFVPTAAEVIFLYLSESKMAW